MSCTCSKNWNVCLPTEPCPKPQKSNRIRLADWFPYTFWQVLKCLAANRTSWEAFTATVRSNWATWYFTLTDWIEIPMEQQNITGWLISLNILASSEMLVTERNQREGIHWCPLLQWITGYGWLTDCLALVSEISEYYITVWLSAKTLLLVYLFVELTDKEVCFE